MIKIIFNKSKILDSIWENDKIILLIILLIIRHLIKGNTKFVSFQLFSYVFDSVEKNRNMTKENVLLSFPWNVSSQIRRKLILAHENDLILFHNKNGKIAFSLSDKGKKVIVKLEQDNLFQDLSLQIQKVTKVVSNSNLLEQKLMW